MCANHTDVAQKSRAVHLKAAKPSAALDDSSVDPDQWVRFIDSGAAQQVVKKALRVTRHAVVQFKYREWTFQIRYLSRKNPTSLDTLRISAQFS